MRRLRRDDDHHRADGDDSLWIVDFGNALIVQNTEAGVVTSESLTFASTPTALVVEQPGQLIVADANFHGAKAQQAWRCSAHGRQRRNSKLPRSSSLSKAA